MTDSQPQLIECGSPEHTPFELADEMIDRLTEAFVDHLEITGRLPRNDEELATFKSSLQFTLPTKPMSDEQVREFKQELKANPSKWTVIELESSESEEEEEEANHSLPKEKNK